VTSPTIGFWRSYDKSEQSFVILCNRLFGQSFSEGNAAKTWLNANGYWTSWGGAVIITTGLIVNYDTSNTSSYTGTGSALNNLVAGYTNATLYNSPSFTSSGGAYLTFNGASNQYILTTTNLNPSLSPANTSTIISIFTWIYPTGNGVIIDETSQAGWHDSQIEMVAGTLRFSVWPYTTIITSSIATPLNVWYYVGFVYNGTTLTAYVNGVSAGSATFARQTPYNNGGPAPLYYGVGLADGTTIGDGTAGDFRFGALHIYNTALSGANVLYNFNSMKYRFGYITTTTTTTTILP
jgi:hypothetical protein